MGIIGVVAVLTIPNLVTNYQSRSYNTAASNFERKLGEALRVMNTQMTLAGHNSTEEFVDELSRHMKIVNVCKGDKLLDCFEDKVMWGGGNSTPREIDMKEITHSKNIGQTDWDTNIVGVQFANGTNAMIAYNPQAKQDPFNNDTVTITGSASKSNGSVSLGTDALAILYDTNGFKSPNHNSKDLRTINVRRLGAACAFELGRDLCITQLAFTPTPIAFQECNDNKTKWGIKECYHEIKDYWAGAVKQCGGVSKLPSAKQLADIANYIYGVSNISENSNKSNLSIADDSKTSSLGLDLTSGTTLVWSNIEYSKAYSYFRRFNENETVWNYKYETRYGNAGMAFCVDQFYD